MAPPGMEEMQQQLQSMFQNLGGNRTRTRKVKVREALKLLTDEEAGKLINEDELKIRALANAEQNGIVFIDEIDKVTRRQETLGADVSREGVQRDLLPLVEGSTVATKYGPVKTDHVLFIASGAFSLSKPSDLIPELQGRLPIRVELDRKSTRLNSSHSQISYAVFCLKKKKQEYRRCASLLPTATDRALAVALPASSSHRASARTFSSTSTNRTPSILASCACPHYAV